MPMLRIDPEMAARSDAAAKRLGIDLPEFAKRQMANQMHAMMIVRTLNALADRFGDEVWKITNEVNYRLGEDLSEDFCAFIDADPEDARSLTRIIDVANTFLDIVGSEAKREQGEVVRHEHACFLSPMLHANDGHHYCGLYQTLYRGVLNRANPEAGCNNLSVTRSRGNGHCEIITMVGKDDSPKIPDFKP